MLTDILRGWPPAECATLASCPVLNAAIYDSVRFHHRKYLTAEWFRRLLERAGSRRRIEQLFFRRQYDLPVVVPSRRRSTSISTLRPKRSSSATIRRCWRAVRYLFTWETRLPFSIEGETPTPGRTERFVAALRSASRFDVVDEAAIVRLQYMIVDPRYAATGWRTFQNFVGETTIDFREEVHVICPGRRTCRR